MLTQNLDRTRTSTCVAGPGILAGVETRGWGQSASHISGGDNSISKEWTL